MYSEIDGVRNGRKTNAEHQMQVVHTFCLNIIMEKWRIVLWSDVLARTESVRGAEDRDRSMSGDYCFLLDFFATVIKPRLKSRCIVQEALNV